MSVVKRNGLTESIKFDKITARITKLSKNLNVQPIIVAQKVIVNIGDIDGIKTTELDKLASEICANMMTVHPDYGTLGARITASNIQKQVGTDFAKTCQKLYKFRHNEKSASLLSDDAYNFIMKNIERLSSAIKYSRDFNYNYHGIMTLMKSYLFKIEGNSAETPQQMLMRISCGIHFGDDANSVDDAIETYELISQGYFTHATPTLFNAGTPKPQMSSCFLVAMKDDSIDGIYDTLKECAQISQSAGGIGLHIHNVRATGSYIAGTNGYSNGIVPMSRVFNNTARYVDQGGGKRKGSFAFYLEPWHPDIFAFLELKRNDGVEEMRARDLFYGLWICDLFMERVKANKDWSLFCPSDCPDLLELHSEKFNKRYIEYEMTGKARRVVKARDLWTEILKSQIETGTPYMLYKDACNAKSNHQHLGAIKSSNLCCEIIEYSSPEETAVCNLASIALNKFVHNGRFDFETLGKVVPVIVRNLNKIIDKNYYPTECARRSNVKHRPIGIGVQGLADTFALLDMPFDSPKARQLNKDIFEAIYYYACVESTALARRYGAYDSFKGSPLSKGKFQFDFYNQSSIKLLSELSTGWITPDWIQLRQEVIKYGMRNSLLTALMPTASTAQILGNAECFEPFTSNIYVRRTLAGEFVCINKHLVRKLESLNLWSSEMTKAIIRNKGSIQNIKTIPADIKKIYRTVWEISQKSLLEMSVDRAPFICQSQSFNVHIAKPTLSILNALHFTGWSRGLKTGMYYLRTRPAVDPIQFTVEKELTEPNARRLKTAVDKKNAEPTKEEILACSINNKDDCEMCGS